MVAIVFPKQGCTARTKSGRIFGREPDRLAEIGDGAVEPAFTKEGEAAVVKGWGKTGVQPDRLAKFRDGAVEISFAEIRDAAIVECGRVIGLKPQRRIVVCNCTLIFALAVIGASAVVISPRKIRVQTYRRAVVRDGTIIVAVQVIGAAEIEEDDSLVGRIDAAKPKQRPAGGNCRVRRNVRAFAGRRIPLQRRRRTGRSCARCDKAQEQESQPTRHTRLRLTPKRTTSGGSLPPSQQIVIGRRFRPCILRSRSKIRRR